MAPAIDAEAKITLLLAAPQIMNKKIKHTQVYYKTCINNLYSGVTHLLTFHSQLIPGETKLVPNKGKSAKTCTI